jgi:nucleotide-binding universal stress UspA family protein
MNKILVAIDGSDSAAEALEFGIELATEHDAELILVHVVPAVDLVPSGLGIGCAFPHEPSVEDRALLEDAAAAAEEHDVRATTVLLTGNTVDEIVAYADSHSIDLIVVGSRGHGPIATALLGSVSRGILGESKRAVLVVRGGAPVPHSNVRRPAGIGMGF